MVLQPLQDEAYEGRPCVTSMESNDAQVTSSRAYSISSKYQPCDDVLQLAPSPFELCRL